MELLSHRVENLTRFYARPILQAASVILDDVGEDLYVVESLPQRKIHRDQVMWFVKWLGYPAHESTWEEEINIKHISHWHQLLEDFQNRQSEVKSGGCNTCNRFS